MIPKPKKLTEEQKKELRQFYPPFVNEKIIELNTHPEINDRPNTEITDFYPLHLSIWKMSNKDYQEKHWVRQEPPMSSDNYMETMEEFLSDGRAVLDTSDYAVKMSSKQREMLQKLYYMVEDFELAEDTPEDPGHGINDAEIISHPKWHQIQDYAKLVYEELSGDDLDAWEKSKLK